MSANTDAAGIVLFDGRCNLCNGSVKFIIRHDPRGRFRFASLQSDRGRKIVAESGRDPADIDTIVLVQGGRAYDRSSAALRIAQGLGFPLALLSVFLLIPPPLRDLVYRWIARNRYRWFGTTEACLMPTADVRTRFLSD